jgi:alpha-amylase
MCTKFFNDGDVHKYFNPYNSPYEAFIAYMNVMQDMRLRLDEAKKNESHGINIHRVKPLRFSEM